MLGPEPALATSDASILRRQPFVGSHDVVRLLGADEAGSQLPDWTDDGHGVLAGVRDVVGGRLDTLLPTLAGTLLVASGAAALNQWLEHPFDARMRRTARRPIAAGRIDPIRALAFGAALSLAGAIYLALAANALASLLGDRHA